MTFINRRKSFSYQRKNREGVSETHTISGPVPYDPKSHEVWEADLHLCRNGLAVARLRSNLNHAVWVIPNDIDPAQLDNERKLDTTPLEPIEVAVGLKLHVRSWEETKTELQRITRRRLRYIVRCLRSGRKIENQEA
jgi:hypothetical protein